MKISPINNTSFQAKFRQSETLEKMILNSDKNTLGRFNDILDKAEKLEENTVYYFDMHSHLDNNNIKTAVATFCLMKDFKNNRGLGVELVHSVTKPILEACKKNRAVSANIYKNTLKDFLPKLEEMFANYKRPSEKIIRSIARKLV